MGIGLQLKRLLQEPLLHFLLIGIGVFLIYPQGQGRPAGPGERQTVIEITEADVERLVAQFAATWTRPPTAVERQGLIESLVREEVLYREALALGLDAGDPVIRQRLQLKMEYIGEAVAAPSEPTEAELEAWYAAHAGEFTPAARVSFEQVMLADAAEVDDVLAALTAGADPAAMGPTSLLPQRMEEETAVAVNGLFGPGFHDAVMALPEGQWAGPVPSAFGMHLVRRGAAVVPEAPPLAAVRDAVLNAWRAAQAGARRDAQYAALRARYDIRLPERAE